MSQNQYKYNIYCYKHCYFYQAIEFDGQEVPTRITVPINEINGSINEINTQPTITFVTAFLNINNCDINHYFPYFERLAKSKIPIVLFMDINYKEYSEFLIKTYSNVKIIKYITKIYHKDYSNYELKKFNYLLSSQSEYVNHNARIVGTYSELLNSEEIDDNKIKQENYDAQEMNDAIDLDDYNDEDDPDNDYAAESMHYEDAN
jgi:hypothetical protein